MHLPLLLLSLIIIGCATAGIDLTKAPGHVDAQCAKDCQLAHVSGIHDGQMVTEGPAQHHVFGIRPQDVDDYWIDENDKSDNRTGTTGKGRRHSVQYSGPNTGVVSYFQIVGQIDGQKQTVRVYQGNKLIDIIEDPRDISKVTTKFATGYFPSRITEQNTCLWQKCLEPSWVNYAPLEVGEKCALPSEGAEFSSFLNFGDYTREAAPGANCGYWMLSIRSKFTEYKKAKEANPEQ
ncbi:hypothetical protein PRIPAC_87289 [Pristionchus pacificus]|uniref:Uncharacterized protein n=1 Tax=Pristionchus pacificus TaxID=54126 RepID=A0A2A6B8S2_PRIPA|nr:hypothetical protein PRIPAC_87289 [Pristionchus pacificus]|eukprot:PDM62279.1 hypothetical protein PRIPAC_51721 [Pristionchus pacificus]